MGRVGREIERIGRAALPVAGAVVGGMLGGPAGAAAGYTITSGTMQAFDKPDMPSVNDAGANVETADPSLSTPTTPENRPTQSGSIDSTDTGFGDITSIFGSLTKQEDEWDKFLGRYSKK